MSHAAGERYGRWTLLRFLGGASWSAKCDCGNERAVGISNLTFGSSSSCGCSRREGLRHRFPREWRIWKGMRARCHSPGTASYRIYGGRGIHVCRQWRCSFKNFMDDMGPCPNDDMSLDRVDNNSGYGPHNCRWATWAQQASNRRTNIMVTAFGQTKTIAEWTRDRRCTVKPNSLRYRLLCGVIPETAISSPPFGVTK